MNFPPTDLELLEELRYINRHSINRSSRGEPDDFCGELLLEVLESLGYARSIRFVESLKEERNDNST